MVKFRPLVLMSLLFASSVPAVRIEIGAMLELILRGLMILIALFDETFPIMRLVKLVEKAMAFLNELSKNILPAFIESIVKLALELINGCKVSVPAPPNPKPLVVENLLRSLVNVRLPVPLLMVNAVPVRLSPLFAELTALPLMLILEPLLLITMVLPPCNTTPSPVPPLLIPVKAIAPVAD